MEVGEETCSQAPNLKRPSRTSAPEYAVRHCDPGVLELELQWTCSYLAQAGHASLSFLRELASERCTREQTLMCDMRDTISVLHVGVYGALTVS